MVTQQLLFDTEIDETIIMNDAFRSPQQEPVQQQPAKVPGLVQLACAWPLLLVAVGGLIGGASVQCSVFSVQCSVFSVQCEV